MHRASVATVALWVATAAALVLDTVATVDLGTRLGWWITATFWLVAAVPITAGGLVRRHDPANWTAPCLTLIGTAALWIGAVGTWTDALAAAPSALHREDLVLLASQGIWMWHFIPTAMVLVVFPTGRPRTRRAAWLLAALPATGLLFMALLVVSPGPLMPPITERPAGWPSHPVFGYAAFALVPWLLVLLAAAAQSVRARRAATDDPVLRAQLRWMTSACLLIPLTLVLCWLSFWLLGAPALVAVGLFLFYLAVPAAAMVAMFRHDLYEADRALLATMTYGLLAALVVVAYAAVSSVVGLLVGGDSVAPAVLATAVVMVALVPARRRLLSLLGRWLVPERDRGLRATAALLTDVHAGRDRPERLQAVLREALGDPGLLVGYRRPGSDVDTTLDGEPLTQEGTPILIDGERVGRVVVSPGRAPVARDVADSAALLADSVRSRWELALLVEELEHSRARLLSASDEERRRLERDLHDGAQQRLVALGMRLRIAQRQAGRGEQVDLDRLLDGSVHELGEAVAELRRIAHGLRPSSLDDGLPAALQHLDRTSPVPLQIRCDVDRVPEQVALAAYYVAHEAVANAVKHARAEHIAVTVERREDEVVVAVRDEGTGGAVITPGSGLAGLRDRVAAVGGRLSLTSVADGGTTVEAVLPCGS